MDLSVVAAYKLPEPDSSWTIPIAIALGVLALIVLLRKLIVVAILLGLLAVAFVAYQNGAFDKWVDKGKVVIDQNINTG